MIPAHQIVPIRIIAIAQIGHMRFEKDLDPDTYAFQNVKQIFPRDAQGMTMNLPEEVYHVWADRGIPC